MKKTKSPTRVKRFIAFRPDELAPLVQLWLDKNPCATISRLMRRALLNELRPIAGKRFKHLYQ